MKDWKIVARQIIDSHDTGATSKHDYQPCHIPMLIEAIAKALEDAANPVNISEHDPWMGRLANKIADFSIRIGALEKPELSVSYGPAPGKPALVSDKWLEDLNNKLAQITQRVNILSGRQQVTEDVQRGTHDLITTWKAEMVDRGTWEARVAAIEGWRDRMEASAKETVEKLKAMRGEA